MTEYAPIYMVLGLLIWGAIFVIVSDLGEWIKKRNH